MRCNTDHPFFRLSYLFIIMMALLFAAHLPFLQADPDIHISFSRGPFTDEGLNTIQVRNWVNHGQLDLAECDNLLKTPLLGFPLALTYKLFGPALAVSRLHVMVFVLIALIIFGSDPKNRGIVLILIPVSFLQYQVFQFTHFSLAEMLSSAALLLAIHFLSRSSDPEINIKNQDKMAILSGVFLSMAWFFKIQFIYLVVLLPLVQSVRLLTEKSHRRLIIRQGFITSATLLFFLALYLLAWYLPNREVYDHMMAHQSGEFSVGEKTREYIHFNISYFFLKGWMQWFIYVFLTCLATGIVLLFKKHSNRYPVLFISSLAWFLLECHKLAMVYLPTRYQISLLVSMGLLISIVLNEIISFREESGKRARLLTMMKTAAICLILLLLSINITNYFKTLERRNYAIRDTNAYLAERLNPGDLAIGAWAPSLTWKSKAKAIPVWNHFLNYNDPVNRFNPRAVIAETDEQDSEQAYRSQGIILDDLADSTKIVTIGQWEVGIYWVGVLSSEF